MESGTDVSARSPASWMPMIVITMAQVLLLLNVTALKMCIDGLVDSFGAPASSVKSAIVIYSLVVAALIIVGARIGEHFGPRAVFSSTIALFALAMTIMAVSPGPRTMFAAQIVAGVAAAAMVPTLVMLVGANYSGERQSRALGWLGAAQAMGIVPAVFLAGLLSTWVGWRYTFGAFVLLALAIYPLSFSLQPDAVRKPVSIDTVGLTLAGGAILLIGAGFGNLTDWSALIAGGRSPDRDYNLSFAPLAIASGVLLLKAFLMWSARYEASGGKPLIAIDVFSSARERSALFAIFLIGVIGSAITFVIPLYIEVIQGRNSLYTAIAIAPFALSGFAGAILVMRLRNHLRPRQVAQYAFASVALGSTLLGGTIHNDWSDIAVILSMALAGFGEGALATLLFKLLASRARAGAVAPLCGTAEYLAAGVGTSLASALVIGVLAGSAQRELSENPLLTRELASQVDLDRTSFISNDRLLDKLQVVAATESQMAEAVRINTEVRLHSLKVCFFTLAGLALLALLPSAALSGYADEPEQAGST
jgi:predicted MFS family arabinose efflux permease